MASVLVTGGAGFIGSHLVEGLLEKGHQVRVIDNLANSKIDNISHVKDRIEFIEGTITDLESVNKAVEGVEYVFHQAALGSVPRSVKKPLDTHHANVTGTLNIAIASAAAGVKRVISASSSAVYGGIMEVPKKESMMPVLISPYGASKISAEHYLEAFYHLYGLESVSLRYSNVFGPRQNPDFQYSAVIPKFIKAIMNDQSPTIFGDGEQTRDFTFVKDVVNANILSMKAKKTGAVPLNIARGQETTINQLVEIINKILGKDIKPVYEDRRKGDPLRATNDITRATEMIGYSPKYTVEEGLKITVEWYKSR